jgi:hypothetical protein
MRHASVMELSATWLLERQGTVVSSHEIELSVPRFIAIREGKTVNPTTVSRQFRQLRSDPQLLCAFGLAIEAVPGKKEGQWKVSKRITSLPSVASAIAA